MLKQPHGGPEREVYFIKVTEPLHRIRHRQAAVDEFIGL